MSFKKVDHVAIAVPNLEDAIALYKSLLGKDPEHIEEVSDQKVRAAFFGVGESNLELLFPFLPRTAAESLFSSEMKFAICPFQDDNNPIT